MKFKLVPILFLIVFLSNNFGQDYLTSQLNYAEKLANYNQYFEAITEYKRLLFFDSSGVFTYQANYKIGECYKAGAKFDDAIKYFSIAEKYAKNFDDIYNCKIQIIRSNILRRTTNRALQLCAELEKDNRFQNKIDEINYWRGWTFIFADDWINAAKSFELINPNHELKILAERTEKEKVSVTFAKVISYILPGSGAIYTGNILSGLMSLGWNILAGYLTINSFVEERAFGGIVIGELVWLRFYRGSIQNAEKFAKEKNLDVANKSLRYLQYEYKGIKP